MGNDDVLEGPIAQIHTSLGAKCAEFGGWNMPLSYAGVVSEHTSVRELVGLFDVSHLGKALGAGAGAGVAGKRHGCVVVSSQAAKTSVDSESVTRTVGALEVCINREVVCCLPARVDEKLDT
jgi:glycine cleavage system aminomethyltransferase T